MALTAASLDLMLDELATAVSYASLHTDAIGSGEGNEVSGGAPAYARRPIEFTVASGGEISLDGNVTFNVPASTVIRRVGLWDSPTNGVFLGDAPIEQKSFVNQGTYTLTSLTITLT